jgi:enoyl-CoA hydratase/carnithine racemase
VSISVNLHNAVAVVELDRGATHPLDLALVNALSRTVRELGDDPDIRGMVLTGAGGKFFSIGFDLPNLIDLGRAEFEQFYRAFNRTSLDVYSMPKPTVAALNGHAVAGGCVLALCCDYRFVKFGKTLAGLNEVKLGVPVPYPADCILRRLVGERTARDIMESGAFYPPDEALRLGLVDRVLPGDRVVPEAIDKAGELGRLPWRSLQAVKRNRVETTMREILTVLEKKERLFLDCWFSDAARARLKVAAKKF